MRHQQIIVSCILVIAMIGIVLFLFKTEMKNTDETKKSTTNVNTPSTATPDNTVTPLANAAHSKQREMTRKKLYNELLKQAEANLSKDELRLVAEAKLAFSKDLHYEEKIEILEGLIGIAHPDVIDIVQKALNDEHEDVRLAAVELLEDFESELILPAVEKALYDKSIEVRETAMNSLMYVDSPDATNLLLKGVDDKAEEIREVTFDILEDRDPKIQEDVFETAIRSKHEDVKERVLEMIVDIPSHRTMQILIDGMKTNNKEYREEISDVIDFFVSQEFDSYEEAVRWWNENKDDFDDELFEKD